MHIDIKNPFAKKTINMAGPAQTWAIYLQNISVSLTNCAKDSRELKQLLKQFDAIDVTDNDARDNLIKKIVDKRKNMLKNVRLVESSLAQCFGRINNYGPNTTFENDTKLRLEGIHENMTFDMGNLT